MKITEMLLEKIKTKSKILLIFDYDGTLTPIVGIPSSAKLDDKVKDNLEILAGFDFIKLAIVTGRNIDDFIHVSNINSNNISIYGMHGGEYLLNNHNVIDFSDDMKEQLLVFKKSITKLSLIPGIFIEDKVYSISLHYRFANREDSLHSIADFIRTAESLNLCQEFKFLKGKKVIELLPKSFSKINAVNDLIHKFNMYIPVYFGDDVTDIDAFDEVKKFDGYAIGVGRTAFNKIDECITVKGLQNFINTAVKLK
jgi:trehalose-phosphatase